MSKKQNIDSFKREYKQNRDEVQKMYSSKFTLKKEKKLSRNEIEKQLNNLKPEKNEQNHFQESNKC